MEPKAWPCSLPHAAPGTLPEVEWSPAPASRQSRNLHVASGRGEGSQFHYAGLPLQPGGIRVLGAARAPQGACAIEMGWPNYAPHHHMQSQNWLEPDSSTCVGHKHPKGPLHAAGPSCVPWGAVCWGSPSQMKLPGRPAPVFCPPLF